MPRIPKKLTKLDQIVARLLDYSYKNQEPMDWGALEPAIKSIGPENPEWLARARYWERKPEGKQYLKWAEGRVPAYEKEWLENDARLGRQPLGPEDYQEIARQRRAEDDARIQKLWEEGKVTPAYDLQRKFGKMLLPPNE